MEAQLAACREWATACGCKIVGEYKEVISGRAQNPPELKRALAQAKAEQAALICISPDRLTRSLALLFERLDDFRRQGITVFFVK